MSGLSHASFIRKGGSKNSKRGLSGTNSLACRSSRPAIYTRGGREPRLLTEPSHDRQTHVVQVGFKGGVGKEEPPASSLQSFKTFQRPEQELFIGGVDASVASTKMLLLHRTWKNLLVKQSVIQESK